MGWHMRRSGYIPIDRENPRAAAKSIIEAAAIIQGGVNAIAFRKNSIRSRFRATAVQSNQLISLS